MDSENEILEPLIANVRHLLRTVDIDIADKDTFKNMRGKDQVRYQPLNDKGKFWISLKEKRKQILDELTTIEYNDMKSKLDALLKSSDDGIEEVKYVFNLFGRATYELVGTRWATWEAATTRYQRFSDMKKN